MSMRLVPAAVVLAAAATTACTRSADGDAPPAAAAAPSASAAALDAYEVRARELVGHLTAGDLPAARAGAESLLAQAAELAPAFGERHPQCADYLAASLRVRETWPSLDAATIERDYHDDAALPEVAQDGAACYHMKDLIVHPATALVLLSQSAADFAQSKHEIEEVIAHLAAVRGALTP